MSWDEIPENSLREAVTLLDDERYRRRPKHEIINRLKTMGCKLEVDLNNVWTIYYGDLDVNGRAHGRGTQVWLPESRNLAYFRVF